MGEIGLGWSLQIERISPCHQVLQQLTLFFPNNVGAGESGLELVEPRPQVVLVDGSHDTQGADERLHFEIRQCRVLSSHHVLYQCHLDFVKLVPMFQM